MGMDCTTCRWFDLNTIAEHCQSCDDTYSNFAQIDSTPTPSASAREVKLMPCPFCGSVEVDSDGWKSDDGRNGPSCNDCGATAETITQWNSRPHAAEEVRKATAPLIEALETIARKSQLCLDAPIYRLNPDDCEMIRAALDAARKGE